MKEIVNIDDEKEILEILEQFLTRFAEYHISTFSNPINGLEYIKSTRCDLVLLDIMMPQMDGLEVLKNIKQSNYDVEVIMMTTYSTLERTIEAHKFGAKNYITKPFESLKILKNKIDKVLNL